MTWKTLFVWLCAVCLSCVAVLQAQQPAQRSTSAAAEPEAPRVVLQGEGQISVLRLMKFSGALRDPLGNPRSGVVGLTFSLFRDQQGGIPLWLETQNVQLDEQGRYTVLLGGTKSEGLPLELFSSGEARWLGVQANLPGEEEQPRVLLVSVPYALKAADAETLGGKPSSAFVLTEKVEGREDVAAGPGKEAAKEGPPRYAVGTLNYVQKVIDTSGTLGDSSIFDNGKVGIGTTNPQGPLHIERANGGANWGYFYLNVGSTNPAADPGPMLGWNRSALHGESLLAFHSAVGVPGSLKRLSLAEFDGTTLSERLTVKPGGNVGIGTTNPTQKLDVVGNIKLSSATSNEINWGDVGFGAPSDTSAGWKLHLWDDVNPNLDYGFGIAGGELWAVSNGKFSFRPGGGYTEKVTIESSGNVAIVTTADGNGIRLTGNVNNPGLMLASTAAGGTTWNINSTGGTSGWGQGRLAFVEGAFPGTSRMAIIPGGSVGIGTTSPTEKLEVAGKLKVTGTGNGIIFPDGSLQTTAAGSLAFMNNGDLARLKETVKEQELQIKGLQVEVEALKARLEALLSGGAR